MKDNVVNNQNFLLVHARFPNRLEDGVAKCFWSAFKHKLPSAFLHLRRPYLLLALASIIFSAGSYLLVSGVSMIWTVLCSFVSAVLFLNKTLAELMVRGIILFAIVGFTAFMSGVLLFVTRSITVHDFICKLGRPNYVIMGNNRTHCNTDIIMCNNIVMMETASLRNTY